MRHIHIVSPMHINFDELIYQNTLLRFNYIFKINSNLKLNKKYQIK